jgi:hypothetical protein
LKSFYGQPFGYLPFGRQPYILPIRGGATKVDTVTLSNGIPVLKAEVVAVVMVLNKLLAADEIRVLKELAAKAQDNDFQLSSDSIAILSRFSIADYEGRVHANARAIVNTVLHIEGDDVQVTNLWPTADDKEALQAAVDSLDDSELSGMVMAVSFGDSVSHLYGYEKVAKFCVDGRATEGLINALFAAADSRF